MFKMPSGKKVGKANSNPQRLKGSGESLLRSEAMDLWGHIY